MPKRALVVAPAVPDAEVLAAILRELLALRRDFDARFPMPPDDAALTDLLRAIHGAVGDRVGSAGDLLIHAALPLAADLHAAIVATVGCANAIKLGKALARAEGRELGGLTVVRVDSDSTGILWSVRRG